MNQATGADKQKTMQNTFYKLVEQTFGKRQHEYYAVYFVIAMRM